MTGLARCPEHSRPDEVFARWPCPDDCSYFRAEIDEQLAQIRIGGNFFRTWVMPGGVRVKQEYRNFEPFGEPVAWGEEKP